MGDGAPADFLRRAISWCISERIERDALGAGAEALRDPAFFDSVALLEISHVICFQASRLGLPLSDEFRRYRDISRRLNAFQLRAEDELVSTLDSAGLWSHRLSGRRQYLSLYEGAAFPVSRDIDLLVAPAELAAAKGAVGSLGYTQRLCTPKYGKGGAYVVVFAPESERDSYERETGAVFPFVRVVGFAMDVAERESVALCPYAYQVIVDNDGEESKFLVQILDLRPGEVVAGIPAVLYESFVREFGAATSFWYSLIKQVSEVRHRGKFMLKHFARAARLLEQGLVEWEGFAELLDRAGGHGPARCCLSLLARFGNPAVPAWLTRRLDSKAPEQAYGVDDYLRDHARNLARAERDYLVRGQAEPMTTR